MGARHHCVPVTKDTGDIVMLVLMFDLLQLWAVLALVVIALAAVGFLWMAFVWFLFVLCGGKT